MSTKFHLKYVQHFPGGYNQNYLKLWLKSSHYKLNT